ncbi:hypothetical protein CP978_33935 [Streptomyces nodosus]|uniref:Uncharacterized protein n=1 Tax=Streptomyces nodosus TaxID=40318 RepID=A0A5P2WHQ1_9ACTN|nr:hypothetical protein CP978_33935 [Streptomyces nodosus]
MFLLFAEPPPLGTTRAASPRSCAVCAPVPLRAARAGRRPPRAPRPPRAGGAGPVRRSRA